MADDDAAADLLHALWAALGGDPGRLDHVKVKGHAGALPSIYDVTGLAAATVAAATLAAAEFGAVRAAGPDSDLPDVRCHRLAASAAFASEALLRPIGWERPAVWDPIAGNYRAADGWVRLHTNYRYHRQAALRALELRDSDGLTKDVVAAAVAERSAAQVESAVVGAGGCAAVMYTSKQWAKHEHGQFAVVQPPIWIDREAAPEGPAPQADSPDDAVARPLAGVRVLDLTRVIAGPVATRTLAAWGAQVLRIDPPGFAEVQALLPDVTAGKYCTALELTDEADRARFESLIARADVVVHGLRPDALAGLGYSASALRAINPGIVLATLNAYGWTGPWAGRRGFDSLVQMSCGIAAASGSDTPGALPVQALDHGTGYLLAAAICRALTGRLLGEGTAQIRGSLVGTANLLLGTAFSGSEATAHATELSALLEPANTEWGPAEVIPPPGTIGGQPGHWDVPAGSLGRHPARFPGPVAGRAAGPSVLVDQSADSRDRLIP